MTTLTDPVWLEGAIYWDGQPTTLALRSAVSLQPGVASYIHLPASGKDARFMSSQWGLQVVVQPRFVTASGWMLATVWAHDVNGQPPGPPKPVWVRVKRDDPDPVPTGVVWWDGPREVWHVTLRHAGCNG